MQILAQMEYPCSLSGELHRAKFPYTHLKHDAIADGIYTNEQLAFDSCIVSQLTYSCGGSVFGGGNGR